MWIILFSLALAAAACFGVAAVVLGYSKYLADSARIARERGGKEGYDITPLNSAA